MKTGFLFSLLAIALLIAACNGSKKTADPPNSTAVPTDTLVENHIPDEEPILPTPGIVDLVMEMRKSACFGKCPVYTLKIFSDGRLEYHGDIHTDKLGVYKRQLTEKQFLEIAQAIRSTNLWQYEDSYSSGATDFPITTITHYKEDTLKTVKGDFERPQAVQQLEKQMIALADSGDWIQQEVQVPYYAIPNEIIVELEAGVSTDNLLRDFAKQDLKIKERIAPNLNLWLLTFDEEKERPGRMVILLKKYRGVKAVDFNKKLENRR